MPERRGRGRYPMDRHPGEVYQRGRYARGGLVYGGRYQTR